MNRWKNFTDEELKTLIVALALAATEDHPSDVLGEQAYNEYSRRLNNRKRIAEHSAAGRHPDAEMGTVD